MYSANWALEHSVTALRLRASLNMFSSKLLGSRVTSSSLPLCLLCSPLLYITVWSAPRLFAVYMLPGVFIWKDNFLVVYTLHGFTKPPVPWQLQTSFFTSSPWSPELRALFLPELSIPYTPGTTLHSGSIPPCSHSSFSSLCHYSEWCLV